MICITVVHSPKPRAVHEVQLQCAPNATVQDVLRQSGVLQGLAPQDADALSISIWGRKATLHHHVREGDRVELCRPLVVDPKTARRERFAQQGAKTAGLFAQRRKGAKAGY